MAKIHAVILAYDHGGMVIKKAFSRKKDAQKYLNSLPNKQDHRIETIKTG